LQRQPVHLLVDRQKRQRERQIEARPFFANVCRRQIDEKFSGRKGEAGIEDRGSDSLASFPESPVGEADDHKCRRPRSRIRLDTDDVAVDAVHRGRMSQ